MSLPYTTESDTEFPDEFLAETMETLRRCGIAVTSGPVVTEHELEDGRTITRISAEVSDERD